MISVFASSFLTFPQNISIPIFQLFVAISSDSTCDVTTCVSGVGRLLFGGWLIGVGGLLSSLVDDP